jgi:hypothetical protein
MSENQDRGTDLDEMAQRVRALSDQVVDRAKENGLAWLQGYERVLKNLLDLQEQAAKGTGSDWVATLAGAQADFVRETSSAFIGAMRQQLQK